MLHVDRHAGFSVTWSVTSPVTSPAFFDGMVSSVVLRLIAVRKPSLTSNSGSGRLASTHRLSRPASRLPSVRLAGSGSEHTSYASSPPVISLWAPGAAFSRPNTLQPSRVLWLLNRPPDTVLTDAKPPLCHLIPGGRGVCQYQRDDLLSCFFPGFFPVSSLVFSLVSSLVPVDLPPVHCGLCIYSPQVSGYFSGYLSGYFS